MPKAAARTSTVETRLRATPAITCPARTAVPPAASERKRSMMPPVMSVETLTAVAADP